jgi:hypothetical protein
VGRADDVVSDAVVDPLVLGQRIVAILETGQRDATYKLATLMALIDHCIENLPDGAEDVLHVPIPDLAHRVLALYWQQVRPFEGQELRQRRTGAIARIPDAAKSLREAAGAGNSGLSLDIAMLRASNEYRAAIAKITVALAKQPLPRLQKLPGSSFSDPFLYEDAFLGEHVSMRQLKAHGNAITLKPGVAFGLARLAGLLKPALEIMWVDDVRQMNKFLDAEVPDVAGHLFGRERIAMTPVREAFTEAFGPHCFYCGVHLPTGSPVDHVLPWSLVGIDGLANLASSGMCQVQRKQEWRPPGGRDRRPGAGARPRGAGGNCSSDSMADSTGAGSGSSQRDFPGPARRRAHLGRIPTIHSP